MMILSCSRYRFHLCLGFLFWTFPFLLLGQYQLHGSISDAETGAPLSFANVYLANTSIGVSSGEDGQFQIADIPAGEQVLIFSYVGYQVLSKKIQVNEYSAKKKLTIQLQVTPMSLAIVEVSAKSSKRRKRHLKKFTKAFLGETPNAKACKILNPEVIRFEEQGPKTIVSSTELIEVENRALGYRILFHLEKMEWEGKEVKYAGKPLFELLSSNDPKEVTEWEKRRVKTYLGSSKHFLQSLVADRLEQEGFKIFLAQQKNESEIQDITATTAAAILKTAPNGKGKILTIPSFLKVVYVRKKLAVANTGMGNALKGLGQSAEKDMIQQSQNSVGQITASPISYLFSRKNSLKIDDEGNIAQAEYLLTYGYWAKAGIADLLPFGFTAAGDQAKETKTPVPQMKGFQLSQLLIPLEEIKDGGVPKDGIPAIDQAVFLSAEKADFLKPKENVLAIYHNGIAKAYPIKIMDLHEVVNDQFGDRPVTVTFCPLCASGLAFEAGEGSENRSFGVSGLLYNSDVLIYDRKTESLWSQIKGKAISGPASGTQLNFLPAEFTTWEAWRKRHPESLVLQPPRHSTYDYEKKMYTRYLSTSELIFPVATQSRLLNNKDKVIGIEVDGQFKAYPLKRLARKTSPIADHFNGQDLLIFYDSKSKSARIKDEEGKVLNGMTMFWFAWYAFHPETLLY